MARSLLALAMLFAGCASSQATDLPTLWFKSPDGTIAKCEHPIGYTLAYGVMGMMAPDSIYKNCVAAAKDKGWTQVEKPN